MLTAEQIKKISFKKASIGGYKCEEVDVFIDEVLDTVETLRKENIEITKKSELLVASIEEYRNNQESVSTVLVKSQKEADKTKKEAQFEAEKTVKDAQAEADAILSEARAEADRILKEANARIKREKDMITQITEEAAEIRQKLIEEFEQQIESLKVLPEKAEAENLKKTLDEKYPTQTYSKPSDKIKKVEEPVKEEEGFDTIEAAVEDATSATEDSANAEAALVDDVEEIEEEAFVPDDGEEEEEDEEEFEEDEEEDEDPVKDGKIKIDKSKFEGRFGKLKFGKDYDVNKD